MGKINGQVTLEQIQDKMVNVITTTTSRDVVQTRGGIRIDVMIQTVIQSLGDRVVGVNFVIPIHKK